MTVYVCCICMKPLDETLKLEELVLPQNEEEEIVIYGDESPSEEFGFDDETFPNPTDAVALHDQIDDGDRFIESLTPNWVSLSTEFSDTSSNSQNWSAVVSTPCGHLYHLGCIHSWMDHLEKRGWEPTCAYCRHVIYTSMELIPIFPVSIKDDESDDDFPPKNFPNPLSKKIRDSTSSDLKNKVQDNHGKAKVSKPAEDDRAVQPEANFWFAALLVNLALCFYLGYVNNCMESLDSEDSEDLDAGPLFGTTWTTLITITFTLAVLSDLYFSSNCTNNNR